MRSTLLIANLTALLAGVILGQSAPKPLEFEVAVIKPTGPDAQGSRLMMGPGGGLDVSNMPVRALITFAYNVRDFQLSGGPGWVSADRYEVTAKIDSSAGPAPDPRTLTDQQRESRTEQMRERLRSLLADRFKLAVHRETREAPVYALSVAKNGPKIEEAKEIGARQGLNMNRGRLQGFAAPMPMFATVLSQTVGRTKRDSRRNTTSC